MACYFKKSVYYIIILLLMIFITQCGSLLNNNLFFEEEENPENTFKLRFYANGAPIRFGIGTDENNIACESGNLNTGDKTDFIDVKVGTYEYYYFDDNDNTWKVKFLHEKVNSFEVGKNYEYGIDGGVYTYCNEIKYFKIRFKTDALIPNDRWNYRLGFSENDFILETGFINDQQITNFYTVELKSNYRVYGCSDSDTNWRQLSGNSIPFEADKLYEYFNTGMNTGFYTEITN